MSVAVLTIVAGPNGSGKSTVTRHLTIIEQENLIDADAVARRLNPQAPQRAAILAGREVLTRMQSYLRNRESFIVETTLSGRYIFRIIGEARRRGFLIRLLFIGLDTVEQNIRRVADRVAKGGQDVSEEDIRRRHRRSLGHVAECIRLADIATEFDNSGFRAEPVLEVREGTIKWRASYLPAWGKAHSTSPHVEIN